MTKFNLKAVLLGTAAFSTLATATAGAQTSSPAEDGATVITDVITVRGTRLQLRDAIAQKRELDSITDVVAEDDIGNLPDFNAGEALSRIPGVTLTSDQAEGRFVTIRGLDPDYNSTTVDGVDVASTSIDTRQIEMDVLPASLASSIQVVKTLTADMDANSVGGAINFVSRSPFDYDDGFFAVTGSAGFYEHSDGYNGSAPSGNADLVYSTLFGDADQWGLVVSANYYRRASYLGRIEQGDEILFHPGSGTEYSSRSDRVDAYDSEFFIPEEWKALNYHNDRQRYGGSFRLEWRPEDGSRTWLRGYYNIASDAEARMETKMWNRERNARITYDAPTTGTLNNTEWSTQLGRFDFERVTWGLNLRGEYELGENFTFRPSINLSEATYEQPQTWDRFIQKSADFSFDTSSRIASWNPTTADAFDAGLFDYQKRELNDDRMEEQRINIFADLGWNDQDDDAGWGFRTGFQYREKDKNYDYERTEYRFGDDLTLADINWSNGCPETMPACTNDMFITMDSASIDELVAAYLDSSDTDLRENEDDDALRDYDATEQVSALYGMALWQGERLSGNFGLRYEATDYRSSGFSDNDVAGDYVPTSNENSYNHLLGSANIRYDYSDDLVLRAAFSQSISRPRMSWQAARGESFDFNGSELSITRGNPELRPREADNFDLGLEYYFNEGSSLFSAAVFYKNIDNQIYRTTEDLELLYDQDGDGTEEPTPARVRQYVNGEAASLWGAEFGLTHELDELIPGLGFNVNATIINPDWTVQLEDGNSRAPETFYLQADFTANAVVYYQRGGFEGRLAVNHTGLKLNNLYTSNIRDTYRDQYDDDRTQIDAQLRYDVNEQFSVYLNAWNLTDQRSYEMFGVDQEFTRWESDAGRAFFVGGSFRY
ncbi:TonB-dependent receptor [Maricaulis sp. D1M11]|uniref:TonB-dependent receptor n=1 Tax=Maricaulis sp. D1M11 TaxID=3076117 RepID=UPI0039B596F1